MTVTEFQIKGNTLLSAEQIRPATTRFLNRPLTFAQLQDATAAVANIYRQAGWIVSAYLPRQEIDNGVVTLQVIEAIFGTVRIDGAQPLRVAPDRIFNMVTAAQPVDQLLNGDRIDRALLLLTDLPGITVSGGLQPGRLERQTDLALSITDKPLATGDVGIDNTGSRSVGSRRLNANLSLGSPLQQGDLWSAAVLQTEGVRYLRVSQNMPIGYDGWRAGASASTLNYKVIAPEFAALDIQGDSSTFGLEASYPVLRSRLKNIYLMLNAEQKNFDNRAGGFTSTRYKISTTSIGLAANVFDGIGGGSTSVNVSLSRGRLDLNGSPNQTADALSTQAAGSFTKLRYGFNRQQVITDSLSASVLISGQAAQKNLDSAEKFYLGGVGGVRAYPSNEAGGSSGQMLNMELRARLPHNINVAGFYDWGQVTVNVRNSFVGASALNRYALKGAGLSLGWASSSGTSLKATWSRRIGSNPNATINGNDQDGSLTRNRFWLVASQTF